MNASNLLVELFVEELPPKALQKLGDAFATVIFDQLKAQGLLSSTESRLTAYASPRRLAVHVTEVLAQAEDKAISQKLMPVAVALDAEGKPTAALLKKLAALGADESAVADLKRQGEGKEKSIILSLGNAGEQHIRKAELTEVPHPHGVELAPKVIALVLNHSRMKALHRPIYGVTIDIKARITHSIPARHHASHPRHRQAALPIQQLLLTYRCDDRVDQHRDRHDRCIGITRIGLTRTKHHDLQIDANLRSRQTSSVGCMHGVQQVLKKQVQSIRIKFGHRLGNLQQAGVTHFQNCANCHISTMRSSL